MLEIWYNYDEQGFYLSHNYYNERPEGERWTNVPIRETFVKPKFTGTEWVEGATPQEILENTPVPEEITRRQFKIALSILGKNEQSILDGIAQLPEPKQTIARISYMEAGKFERNNPELITVATAFLQMNSEQIDQVFIIGNQY